MSRWDNRTHTEIPHDSQTQHLRPLPGRASTSLRDGRRKLQVIALQNGETLYIFKDGLMTKESTFGNVSHLSKGEVVQTADGKSITTMGNEVARLNALLKKGHSN